MSPPTFPVSLPYEPSATSGEHNWLPGLKHCGGSSNVWLRCQGSEVCP